MLAGAAGRDRRAREAPPDEASGRDRG
ncbi:uncharacterized protein M6B38_186845 [Iris pallida]|uniref:Uncharacterized protein n=1 Tax=Iris pallida TaxID=29817 RepID=A0AAX6EJ54_IRIPA|nr:uncharacterized protein M6B38_186845 [Iris pallida]